MNQESDYLARFDKAYAHVNQALAEFGRVMVEVLTPLLQEFKRISEHIVIVFAPYLLRQTDPRGRRNLIRGKARKQIKRRYNQYRRGVRRF